MTLLWFLGVQAFPWVFERVVRVPSIGLTLEINGMLPLGTSVLQILNREQSLRMCQTVFDRERFEWTLMATHIPT